MSSIELYLAYVLACVVVVIVPGPNVTVIVANSLRHGARAGLMSVAGTQVGLAVVLAVLVAGLSTLVATMAWWFDWVRLAGAAYLVWLGIRLWRSHGELGATLPEPRRGFFWQGFLVLLSNPKALLFFGAFIPQFVDPAAGITAQVVALGLTFMAVATVFDSGYALLAGGAGRLLSRERVRLVSRLSGSFLIGGGIWLALARR